MTPPADKPVGEPDMEARFWDKVSPEPNSGCWLWTANVNTEGYARFWDGAIHTVAHRWAYERFVGPIPDGLQLDHLCRVRCCVNPAHMDPVKPRENTLRSNSLTAIHAAKTHCRRGHEFSPINTRHYRGTRQCRACYRIRDARKRAERRQEAAYV